MHTGITTRSQKYLEDLWLKTLCCLRAACTALPAWGQGVSPSTSGQGTTIPLEPGVPVLNPGVRLGVGIKTSWSLQSVKPHMFHLSF